MTETRKLAAILVADVVGYSRLAGADEERTLARLRGLRSDLIDPAIAAHHGRIVKRTGDGSIIEFRSVVDAVRCAIEVQTGLIERNAGVPPERRIEFRVGVHLGDVVKESDGDLMGDGVNIAARLEGACEPGGICLSSAAYEQVRDKLKQPFVDLGEKTLKNIARPVRAYGLTLNQPEPDLQKPPSLSLPDKASIAVLPFQNMSGDPEQDYFADGMVEDIVTGLSRIKWLFVVARNSSFVYKGKALDVRQAGRELGVRYLLEGGVRKAGQRLRVTAQLVEAETGAHLWADRFDGGLADVFEFQDQINGGGFDEADRTAGLRHARAALANDVDDATALAVGANVAGFLGKDAKAALSAIERALSCNPSSAIAYYFGATLYAWSGDPVTGTAYAHRALRLSPFDPLAFLAHLAFAIAALHEERYDEAAAWWGKCAQANPDFGGFVMGQAASLALAGRMDEARSACARAIELEPGFSIRTAGELGYAPAIEAKLMQGHRLLGVPER